MDHDVVQALNHLIESLCDAEQGFRTAVPGVGHAPMQRTLLSYADERAAFVRELQAHVRRLGGTPPRRGTVTGALQRALFNLQDAVSGRKGEGAIDEARRADDAACTAYRETLRISRLPADVRNEIERQARRVEEKRVSLTQVRRAA